MVISTSTFPKSLTNPMGRPRTKMIALNPGIRIFCIGYDLDGLIVEIEKSDILRIYSL